jgi:hypothetical protein
MFEQGLFSFLSGAPAIVAQLGGSPSARADGTVGVFPLQLPESSTLPALVYSVVGRGSVNSTAGTNRAVMKRVQIDCYGRHYGDAKVTQAAVKKAVLALRGALRDGTVVSGVLVNSELDAFEEAPFLYCAVLDFNFFLVDPP